MRQTNVIMLSIESDTLCCQTVGSYIIWAVFSYSYYPHCDDTKLFEYHQSDPLKKKKSSNLRCSCGTAIVSVATQALNLRSCLKYYTRINDNIAYTYTTLHFTRVLHSVFAILNRRVCKACDASYMTHVLSILVKKQSSLHHTA